MDRKNKLALPLIIIAILIVMAVFWGQSFLQGEESNGAIINEALEVQSDILEEENLNGNDINNLDESISQ